MSIEEQYRRTREQLSSKWSVERCIPYFQAHTNTYAPLSILRSMFETALSLSGAVGLNIATRADCLPDDVVAYLAELSQRTVLTVELGLQSSHDRTADLINRGHTWAQFCEGYEALRRASGDIQICVHLILGLPGESETDMLETIRCVAALRPHQVKIHLLHVIRGTVLGDMYAAGTYTPMDREAYVSAVVRALELLPPETVIARLTGDGAAEDLLAPLWSRRKREVLNRIDQLMASLDTQQGRYATKD
jgi:radical SAM protein (TIGR01212 family)